MKTVDHFELLHEEIVRGSQGEVVDVKQTTVAEGKTISGLLKFAKLKRLDVKSHLIEARTLDEDGWPNSDFVGYLDEIKK